MHNCAPLSRLTFYNSSIYIIIWTTFVLCSIFDTVGDYFSFFFLFFFISFFKFFGAHLVGFLFFVFFLSDGEVVLRLLPYETTVVCRAEMHLAMAHLDLLNGEVLLRGLLDEAAHRSGCSCSVIGDVRLALEVLQGRCNVKFLHDQL